MDVQLSASWLQIQKRLLCSIVAQRITICGACEPKPNNPGRLQVIIFQVIIDTNDACKLPAAWTDDELVILWFPAYRWLLCPGIPALSAI